MAGRAVVFPGQRLVFEAESQATLEIHSGMMASAILSDTIPCTKLSLHKVEQESVELSNSKVTSIDRAKETSQEPCELPSAVNLAV